MCSCALLSELMLELWFLLQEISKTIFVVSPLCCQISIIMLWRHVSLRLPSLIAKLSHFSLNWRVHVLSPLFVNRRGSAHHVPQLTDRNNEHIPLFDLRISISQTSFGMFEFRISFSWPRMIGRRVALFCVGFKHQDDANTLSFETCCRM